MENQQPTTSKNIIINYGLILGGISILTSLTLYALNKHLEDNMVVGILSFVIMAIIIVLGIKKFKTSNNSYLSFGQALKIGIGIAVIAAILSIIYQQIFQNFIEPDFMAQKFELLNDKMIDDGMDEDMVEQQIEMAKKFQSPLITSAVALAFSAFLGFVVSAIAGAVMQKKDENAY